jgi:hypothetical protein
VRLLLIDFPSKADVPYRSSLMKVPFEILQVSLLHKTKRKTPENRGAGAEGLAPLFSGFS